MVKTHHILFKKEFLPLILNGQKTQTRRIKKWVDVGDILIVKTNYFSEPLMKLKVVRFGREKLQEIDDIHAEGCPIEAVLNMEIKQWWIDTWNSINKDPGTRWEDNPVVSVITFKLLEDLATK